MNWADAHRGGCYSLRIPSTKGGALRSLSQLCLRDEPALLELLGKRASLFFLKLTRCYGEAGCGGLARNSRAAACACVEHHRGASSEAPLRDYVMPGGYLLDRG